MPHRSFKFYSEIVVVTVLTLVAASVWIELIKESFDKLFGNKIQYHLIFALLITLMVTCILWFCFSDNDDPTAYDDIEDIEVIHKPHKDIKPFIQKPLYRYSK